METSKLTVKEKIGYGMGDAGCNIIFGAIMLFVNYFYTDIFGLAPALVGVLLLSVRVIDAVTDPIMGAMADRTRSKYGRFRPWLLWMAFPYALFSVLMFTTPEWTYNSKVIYAFVTYSCSQLPIRRSISPIALSAASSPTIRKNASPASHIALYW